MADPLGLISTSVGSTPQLRLSGFHIAPTVKGPSFKETLFEEIRKVAELQQNAERAVAGLASDGHDDLEQVINATRKADTAFEMLLQVRNKVMEAYEEVKQIRV